MRSSRRVRLRLTFPQRAARVSARLSLTVSQHGMLTLPVVIAAVLVAVFSRAVRLLWLRALLVVAAAYGAAVIALRLASYLTSDDQFSSWAPLLLHLSFGVGAVVGIFISLVSH